MVRDQPAPEGQLEVPPLTAETTELDALRALRRALSRANGHATLYAVCNRPSSRMHWWKMLRTGTPEVAFREVYLKGSDNLLERVTEAATAGEPVFVTGIEETFSEAKQESETIYALNMQRPHWRDHVPVPVVFWVPEFLLGEFERCAPDFYSWRSGVFFFPDVGERELEMLAGPIWQQLERSSLSAEARERRIAELRARLAADRDSTPYRALLLDELALLVFSAGEIDEALRIRREEELPIHDQRGALRERAITLGKIAGILLVRGKTDEALRIIRDEALPVFEQLGDERERAVTLGNIARILASRGEHDEALRLLRDEVLPTFEKLGELRERAVTMDATADVLTAKGEAEEALRIRREEVLPVFEKLGDTYSGALTMGKIADSHVARGQFEEALRILRQEELPTYERLGNRRSRAAALASIGSVLISDLATRSMFSNEPLEQDPRFKEAVTNLLSALAEFRRMKLPEAQQVEGILRQIGVEPPPE